MKPTLLYLFQFITFINFSHSVIAQSIACSSSNTPPQNIPQHHVCQKVDDIIQQILTASAIRERALLAKELNSTLASPDLLGTDYTEKDLAAYGRLRRSIHGMLIQDEIKQRYSHALEFYSFFAVEMPNFASWITEWAATVLESHTKIFFPSRTNPSGNSPSASAPKESKNEPSSRLSNGNDNSDDGENDILAALVHPQSTRGLASPLTEPTNITFSTSIGANFKQEITYPVWSAQDREHSRIIRATTTLLETLAAKASEREDALARAASAREEATAAINNQVAQAKSVRDDRTAAREDELARAKSSREEATAAINNEVARATSAREDRKSAREDKTADRQDEVERAKSQREASASNIDWYKQNLESLEKVTKLLDSAGLNIGGPVRWWNSRRNEVANNQARRNQASNSSDVAASSINIESASQVPQRHTIPEERGSRNTEGQQRLPNLLQDEDINDQDPRNRSSSSSSTADDSRNAGLESHLAGTIKTLEGERSSERSHAQKIADIEAILDETIRKLEESEAQSEARLGQLRELDAERSSLINELNRLKNGSDSKSHANNLHNHYRTKYGTSQ